MTTTISRDEALELLMKYNKDPFHILHGLTVSGVMMWFADTLGYAGESEYWGIVGLLHDIDYEMYPDQHCIKAKELLSAANVSDEMIYSIASHGYGICVDTKPIHLMEKILYATDELTGLINAAVKMRPSKSSMDLELSSLKKKFKDKKFAAGCSRNVIQQGAEMLDWNLDELLEKTILAMRSCEESVNQSMKNLELT
ncbi:putative HD superfamily hydrolase [Desulfosporosinus orientis DSM 765]|uniref:Putative HD superfamily hydrolase n=1 Tax=Desulfosporosinus orientis (strain ATCC 19365 / DSM 765 / NCIMB 8382 / VKM B-1628 / Singapore I) TaxID=768706 RepID=G7WGJ9_DESOD|nr:hydrolase [Desulfosporosinus orientis]AET68076.1 putative HD superfamily hydrolase [Desulfosporosinus orientis DSM 765]